MFQIQYQMTDQMIKEVFLNSNLFRKEVFTRLFFILCCLAFPFFNMWALGQEISEGFFFFMGLAILGCIVLVGLNIFKFYKLVDNTKSALGINNSPIHVELTFSEDSYSMKTPVADLKSSWQRVSSLDCSEKYWIIIYSNSMQSLIPASELTEDIKELIFRKLKENNVKIK